MTVLYEVLSKEELVFEKTPNPTLMKFIVFIFVTAGAIPVDFVEKVAENDFEVRQIEFFLEFFFYFQEFG